MVISEFTLDLDVRTSQWLRMPESSQVFDIGLEHDDRVVLYAVCNPDAILTDRRFAVVPLGTTTFPYDPVDYIGRAGRFFIFEVV